MTQQTTRTPQTAGARQGPGTSPLENHLFRLQHPHSLGMYRSYSDVQAVVDALADAGFPVERTMIVGTDLRLMERVTGRRTWGKVLLGGALSGAWMGLFVGLLFTMLSGGSPSALLTTVLLGIIFFAVWSGIGYALSRGRRDFTSMTATIPMQFELLVEHSSAADARALLVGTEHAVRDETPASSATPARPAFGGRASYGQPAPSATPDAARSATTSGASSANAEEIPPAQQH